LSYQCSSCKKVFNSLEGNFHKNHNITRGYYYSCVECVNSRNRKVAQEKFEQRLRDEAAEVERLKKLYSISDELANKYFVAANNIINKRKFSEKKKWQDLIYFK